MSKDARDEVIMKFGNLAERMQVEIDSFRPELPQVPEVAAPVVEAPRAPSVLITKNKLLVCEPEPQPLALESESESESDSDSA